MMSLYLQCRPQLNQCRLNVTVETSDVQKCDVIKQSDPHYPSRLARLLGMIR